ncbi:hypothetical protein GCM10027275_10460 [Rhabdobacter roseus]
MYTDPTNPPRGLTTDQALQSRRAHGENYVDDKSKNGMLTAVWGLLKEPMLLLLLVAARVDIPE